MVPVKRELGGTDSFDDEAHQHTSSGEDEERATSDFVHEEAHQYSNDQVDDLQNTVDDLLCDRVRDSNLLEHNREIVRYDTVSRPLGKETGRKQDEKPVAVALCPPELAPAVALEFLLHLEGVTDLLHFKEDDLVVQIAIRMAVCQDLVRLLVSALGDVVTRRLWDEPDEADLEERRESLHERGCPPSPGTSDLERPESQPGCDNRAYVPGGVVDGSKDGTVLGVSELGDEKRGCSVGDGHAETNEEAGSDEHAEVDRDGLQSDTEAHDYTADHDTHASTQAVGDVWHEGNGADGTNGHDAREETEERAGRVVEVCLPLRESLETVDHGAIVAVGR